MFDVSQDRQLNHLRKTSKKTYHSVLQITIILPSNLMYLHMFKRHVGLFKLKLHKRTRSSARIFRRSGSHSAAQVPPPAWRRVTGQTDAGSNGRGGRPLGGGQPDPYRSALFKAVPQDPSGLGISVEIWISCFFFSQLHPSIAFYRHLAISRHLQSLQSLHPV